MGTQDKCDELNEPQLAHMVVSLFISAEVVYMKLV